MDAAERVVGLAFPPTCPPGVCLLEGFDAARAAMCSDSFAWGWSNSSRLRRGYGSRSIGPVPVSVSGERRPVCRESHSPPHMHRAGQVQNGLVEVWPCECVLPIAGSFVQDVHVAVPLAHQLGTFDVACVARSEEEAVDTGEEHNPTLSRLSLLVQELWDGEDVGLQLVHYDDVRESWE